MAAAPVRLSSTIRRAITLTSMAGVAAIALACPGPSPQDPGGPDIYRVAVSGAPGGSFLGVWGDPRSQHAYLAGGYVGVDPATLAGAPAGRLVEYTRPGTFVTRCTTDHVLWWVHGVSDNTGSTTVYASGEGGRVLRLRNGICDTLDLGLTFPSGAPTLWGIDALSASDVWFVGGSADPAGTHGVVLRYDGTVFRQVTTVPSDVTQENLYKVAATANGLVIVGSGGTVLYGDASGALTRATVPVPATDNRLFTVACQGDNCWAVGGAGSGILLHADATGWHGSGLAVEPPGLNGVWVQDGNNVFIVGVGGYTMHTNGSVFYVPPTMLTQATLHGVGGFGTTVFAVGGELNVTNVSQRGVILVRGDSSAQFALDGRVYMASGSLRTALGGSGQ